MEGEEIGDVYKDVISLWEIWDFIEETLSSHSTLKLTSVGAINLEEENLVWYGNMIS